MARILWWGIGPEHNTGYGLGTRWYVPLLAALGHEVVIAVMGVLGRDDDPAKAHPDARERIETGLWQGHRVIGPGSTEFGLPPAPVIRAAFGGHDPDLVIALKDPWVLPPGACKRWPTAVWANVDCDPMGQPDLDFFLASGATPVATSQFGYRKMREAGLDPLLVPFGVSGDFAIGDQAEARKALGLPAGAFIAGINAANIGPRKGWGEQFAGFAGLARETPGALLVVHSRPAHPEGVDLRHLAYKLGLNGSPDEARAGDRVLFGSHQRMSVNQMMDWYHAIDVLLACSYGEGVGMPIQEALACGVPVIASDSSAMTEMVTPGCGYLVPCQPWWHPHYQAWWAIPRTEAITTALAKVRHRPPRVPDEARRRYDASVITREHWKPALDILLGGA